MKGTIFFGKSTTAKGFVLPEQINGELLEGINCIDDFVNSPALRKYLEPVCKIDRNQYYDMYGEDDYYARGGYY